MPKEKRHGCLGTGGREQCSSFVFVIIVEVSHR
jgi:hypothetical protein